MIKNENILVTGASGFVGQHMLQLLADKGYQNILATDIVEPRMLPENVKFQKSDLCDIQSLEAVTENVDTIFHIADLFDFFAPYEALYAVNVQGTKNLCRAAVWNDVENMVKFSSSAIYDAGENIREDGDKNPIDRYALTKLLGEDVAVNFSGDMEMIFVRPAVIYGEGSKYGAAQAFLTQALGAKLLGSMILPGEGDKKGCYVHVEDIVNGTLHLYENRRFVPYGNSPNDLAYNISDDTGATPREIAEMVLANVSMNPLSKFLASKGAKLKLPRSVMDPLATVCEAAVKSAKKKGLIKAKPSIMLEKGAVDYMFLGTDLTVNSDKLKATGYEFKHPSSLESMPAVIQWYEQNGWEMFKR